MFLNVQEPLSLQNTGFMPRSGIFAKKCGGRGLVRNEGGLLLSAL